MLHNYRCNYRIVERKVRNGIGYKANGVRIKEIGNRKNHDYYRKIKNYDLIVNKAL